MVKFGPQTAKYLRCEYIEQMLSNKKQIITIFFFISLPFFEFGIDYFFGDQDGKIARFGISKIKNVFQFLIVIIITTSLYKIKPLLHNIYFYNLFHN